MYVDMLTATETCPSWCDHHIETENGLIAHLSEGQVVPFKTLDGEQRAMVITGERWDARPGSQEPHRQIIAVAIAAVVESPPDAPVDWLARVDFTWGEAAMASAVLGKFALAAAEDLDAVKFSDGVGGAPDGDPKLTRR